MFVIIVDKGILGFLIGKIEEKMGIYGLEIVELIFDNCRVLKFNLLGKEGKGFNIVMICLDGVRIGVGV